VAEESGVATVEYALLLALVAIVGLGGWVALSEKIRQAISEATNAISQPLQ